MISEELHSQCEAGQTNRRKKDQKIQLETQWAEGIFVGVMGLKRVNAQGCIFDIDLFVNTTPLRLLDLKLPYLLG
jgi:hypothetical protein